MRAVKTIVPNTPSESPSGRAARNNVGPNILLLNTTIMFDGSNTFTSLPHWPLGFQTLIFFHEFVIFVDTSTVWGFGPIGRRK